MPVMRVALVSSSEMWSGEGDDAPLIAALRELGAHVTTPAWDDRTVDWATNDVCLVRTTWDYHKRRTEFLDWARQVTAVSQLYNPLAVIEWNSIKSYLEELGKAGLPVPPTIWLDRATNVDLGQLLADREWKRGFLKPDVGACASQTMLFDVDIAGIEAAQAHLDQGLPGAGFLVQPFLESVESEGEYSVIFIEGEFTHAVRKVPAKGDYRVMDEYGASDAPVTLDTNAIELARRTCATCEQRLGLESPLLYARVDFLRDAKRELVINEVELVEPSLFFRHCEDAAVRLAHQLLGRVRRR